MDPLHAPKAGGWPFVNYVNKAEQALQTAENAIRLMRERQVTPDPANFTVWYN